MVDTKKRINSNAELLKQMEKIFEERGRDTFNLARNIIFQEKSECEEVTEALAYFMKEYWSDLVRPTLLSLGCEAVGGDPKITTFIAVPMMLISCGIDIHDDLIDESKIKHGRVTLYGKFGRNISLLVGDALLFKGLTLLTQAVKKINKEKIINISNLLTKMFFELGDAEAIELKLRKRFDVSPREYLDIIEKKAADVEAHMHISAILGNGTEKEITSLAKFGRKLGKLIILGDDIIDMTDVEELLHRIKKEHLPLPILFALEDQKTKPKLKRLLFKQNLTEKDAAKLFEIVYDSSSFDKVEKLMKKMIDQGINELRNVKKCKKELEILIRTTFIKI
jgi:geranylgeranyl pyrophosphate synthase